MASGGQWLGIGWGPEGGGGGTSPPCQCIPHEDLRGLENRTKREGRVVAVSVQTAITASFVTDPRGLREMRWSGAAGGGGGLLLSVHT